MRRHVITPLSRATSLASSLLLVVAAGATIASPVLAQQPRGPRSSPPGGAEIAARAKGARLDRANAGTGEFQAKRIVFTPALLDAGADLAAGQIIGVLENDVAGDETGLPAGRYNLFAAQLAGPLGTPDAHYTLHPVPSTLRPARPLLPPSASRRISTRQELPRARSLPSAPAHRVHVLP